MEIFFIWKHTFPGIIINNLEKTQRENSISTHSFSILVLTLTWLHALHSCECEQKSECILLVCVHLLCSSNTSTDVPHPCSFLRHPLSTRVHPLHCRHDHRIYHNIPCCYFSFLLLERSFTSMPFAPDNFLAACVRPTLRANSGPWHCNRRFKTCCISTLVIPSGQKGW